MRPTTSASLVGRARELSKLERVVADSRRGRGSVVVFEGAEGVGKSRLATEAVREASRQGAVPLVAACRATNRYIPYASLREAFRPAFDATDFSTAPELELSGPALRWLFGAGDGSRQVDPPAEAVVPALREGLLSLAHLVAADRGAVMVFDDLHLADAETLSLVELLAIAIVDGRTPMGLVVTVDDDPASANALVRRLATYDIAERFELDALNDDDIEHLLAAHFGTPPSDAAVAGVHEWTAGRPLLIDELVRALAADGWTPREPIDSRAPLDLAEAIQARVDSLPNPGRAALAAAAVLGQHFDAGIVAEVAGLHRRAAAGALTAAVDAGLVLADAAGLRFRHGVLRDAVLMELPHEQRQQMGHRAVDILIARFPGLPGEWCGIAAEAAALAGDADRAASLLIELGQRASSVAGWTSAISAHERALAVGGDAVEVRIRLDVLESVAEAFLVSGDAIAARDVAEQFRGLGEQLDEHEAAVRQAEAELLLARAWAQAAEGDGEAAIAAQHLARARDLAADGAVDAVHASPQLAARIARQEMLVAFGDGRIDDGLEAADEVLAHAETVGAPDLICEALIVSGWWSRAHDVDRAKELFIRAHSIAGQHHLRAWDIRARYELAVLAQLDLGRFDQLADTRLTALDAGAVVTIVSVDLRIAALHLARFEADAALEKATQAAAIAERYGFEGQVATALVAQAAAHALRSEPDAMVAQASEGLARAGDNLDLLAMALGDARAVHALLADDRAGARADLDAAMAAVRQLPFVAPFGFRGLWALLQTVEGDSSAREELRSSGATVFRPNAAYLALADAIVLGRQGRAAEARDIARRAETELSRYGGFCHLAMRLTAEPALADGWGNPPVWLRHAAAFFESTGHAAVVKACHGLMEGAGIARPDRRAAEVELGADLRAAGVTRREVEVLDLVAEGLGNAEIGRRLNLSPRTVEKHVASLQAKTGYGTRTQLQAFAAERLARQSG